MGPKTGDTEKRKRAGGSPGIERRLLACCGGGIQQTQNKSPVYYPPLEESCIELYYPSLEESCIEHDVVGRFTTLHWESAAVSTNDSRFATLH